MAFPFTWRQSWVVKSFTTTSDTSTLLPFQLALVDYDRKSLGSFNVTPNIQFAIGSPSQKQKVTSHPKIAPLINTNRDVSFKSDKIYGKTLLPARVAKPQKIDATQVLYLGYDGLNDCKSLNFQCGKTYMVNVQILPSAATSMVWPKGISDQVEVTIKACPECGDDCVAPNLCSTVIDELITKLNNAWTAPYVLAEKVIDCCPTVDAPDKTQFESYQLTLCDEGDALALARVQNQYPSVKIERIKRIGTQSTYEFWQLQAASAPADFSQSDLIIPDCSTCPSGYTAVPARKLLIVTIDNIGTDTTSGAWLTQVQTKIATATAATKISYDGSASTYIVSVPTSWTNPGAVSETLIYDTGTTTQPKCTLTTPITTAWVLVGSKYKISRKLVLQLENPDCGGTPSDELALIQTAYANNPTIVSGSIALETSGDCQSLFSLEQYCDNLMEDGCDTIALATFKNPVGYKGKNWEVSLCEGWTTNGSGCPVPPTVTDDSCRCGIKFTGALVDLATAGCVFDPVDGVNYDPVRFEVTAYEVLGPGNPAGVQITDAPITRARLPKRRFLSGQEVYREIIKSREWNGNEMYFAPRENYKFNQTEAMQFGVNPNAFYYAVYIPWNKHGHVTNQHMGSEEGREIALYFEEADYSVMLQFLAAYNGYISSTGINLPVITI